MSNISRRGAKHGIVASFTLLGGVLVPFLLVPLAQHPEAGRRGIRLQQMEVARVKLTLGGALAGLVVGLAIDRAANGLPQKTTWRFGMRTLLFAVIASAVLVFGLVTAWQILSLPEPNI